MKDLYRLVSCTLLRYLCCHQCLNHYTYPLFDDSQVVGSSCRSLTLFPKQGTTLSLPLIRLQHHERLVSACILHLALMFVFSPLPKSTNPLFDDAQVVGSSCRSLAVSTTHNTTLLQLLLPPRPCASGPTASGHAFDSTKAQEGLPSADEMCGAVWRECGAAAANPAARYGAGER